MSNKTYYSDDVITNKKVRLNSYFENIVTSLDAINEINVNDNWRCIKGGELNTTFNSLKGKIDSIKNALVSYESFLSTTDTTYRDINSSINDVLSNYINNSNG
jgi:hypothetical protein